MSSEDDVDVFNDFVKKNKEKLKHKFVELPELEKIDKEMNDFIVDSDKEILFSNSDLSDRNLSPHLQTNIRQIKKHKQRETRKPDIKVPLKSKHNPNENLSSFTGSSDKNKKSNINDLDSSDNLFSEDSDDSESLPDEINTNITECPEVLLANEIHKKLDLEDILPMFKTPKFPVQKLDKSCTTDILKPATFPIENKENLQMTPRKKIDLSRLIKTCDNKEKIFPRKFSRLIVESSSESFESSDKDDSFIDDSIYSGDSRSDASDGESVFSSSGSSSSDSDRISKSITVTPRQKIPKQIPQTVPANTRCPEKLDFISSLRDAADNERRDPEAVFYRLKYKSHYKELAQKIYQIYNKSAFNNLLPENIEIEWSTTLRTTAGKCLCTKTREEPVIHSIKIQLSKKVLTDAERLLGTLVHEMCHGAVWVINKTNGNHGPVWKKWTAKAHLSFPAVVMSERCHNYDIHTKFEYTCLNCNKSVKRHSKSIDINRKVCRICKGKFTLFRLDQKGNRIAVGDATKKMNGFSMFVKENYNKYRKSGTSHAEVMKKLSELYKTANKPSNDQDLCSMIGSMNLDDVYTFK